jgi:hypothetical protein
MTDPRNTQPGSYRTSGYGAEAGEETRSTRASGGASVRQNRPGAASPAGWFSPSAGEAAPPVRHREPARSDVPSPYAVESRPTSMYRVPWRSPRPEGAQRPPRTPQPPVARPRRGTPNGNAINGNAGPADSRWPSLTGQRPQYIPVVGPTEALRGRPGGPGVAVPPGAVPGLLDHARQTGWQLAKRVWEDSGVNWEDTPESWEDTAGSWEGTPGSWEDSLGSWEDASVRLAPAAPYVRDSVAVPHAPAPSAPAPSVPGPYEADRPQGGAGPAGRRPVNGYRGDPGPADPHATGRYPTDPRPTDPHATDPHATDPHPTRPDLPVLRVPADSGLGMGPWPIQRPSPEKLGAQPPAAAQKPADAVEQKEPRPEHRDPAEREPADRDLAERGPGERRGFVDRGGPDRKAEGPAARDAAGQEAASQAPPLPRRIRMAGANWGQYPPRDLPGRPAPDDSSGRVPPLSSPAPVPASAFRPSAFAPASPFAPSPAFASPQSYGSAQSYDSSPAFGGAQAFASPPLSAPVAPPLGETDALYRAWQGSVREATDQRTPWTPRRPAGAAARRRRGWQVAKIGVPAAVIVTVGAGALMMLTGRANDMLAERASTAPLSSGQASAGPTSPARAGAGTTSLTLAGYPAERGTVGVAAMWSAGGTTMAVGFADGHPAVWRHAAGGTWSLVSTAFLGGLTGHLTSVAQGPSGWIAVGSVNENGTVQPAVFWSADGVTWQLMTALTALAGSDAQFLGVAAGPGGYLVVGKQGAGSQASVALWWSSDMKSWANGETSGLPGSFAAAAVAVDDGFVAVGSENNCHTIWTSVDGQHWTAHDLAKPSGATTATLQSVAVGQGGRFVAAGFATTSAGDLPIVVTSADDGAHVTQVVLGTSGSAGTVTAVTATSHGYVAVGLAGPANARRAVTWTSADGLTWSPATPLQTAGTSAVTALATTTTPGTAPAVTGTVQRGAASSLFTVTTP